MKDMNVKIKRILMTVSAACFAVLLCGAPSSCDAKYWMDPDMYEELQRPPTARVTIHRIVKYRQGKDTEMTIDTYTRRKITVDVPWFSSRDIEKIEAVPRPSKPGFYDLKLTLSPTGRNPWIMLSTGNMHEDMAFVIDGVFYRAFQPRQLVGESDLEVIVDGPFDQATAKTLEYHSEFNYIKLNNK